MDWGRKESDGQVSSRWGLGGIGFMFRGIPFCKDYFLKLPGEARGIGIAVAVQCLPVVPGVSLFGFLSVSAAPLGFPEYRTRNRLKYCPIIYM